MKFLNYDRVLCLSPHPDDVEYVWHEVQPLIDKALAHAEGELYSEDVLQRIFDEMCLPKGKWTFSRCDANGSSFGHNVSI